MKDERTNYPFGNIMRSIDDYFEDKPSPYYLNSINQFFNRNRREWFPIDVRELNNILKIEASLPGVSKKDIKINLYDTEIGISVKGLKRSNLRSNGKNVIEQTVPLPFKVQEKEIKATYENGLLKIILPKERKLGKQIEIKEEGNEKLK